MENQGKTLGKIHRKTIENHRKTFWKAGKDAGGTDPEGGGGITLIHQAPRPGTPFSYRKKIKTC